MEPPPESEFHLGGSKEPHQHRLPSSEFQELSMSYMSVINVVIARNVFYSMRPSHLYIYYRMNKCVEYAVIKARHNLIISGPLVMVSVSVGESDIENCKSLLSGVMV